MDFKMQPVENDGSGKCYGAGRLSAGCAVGKGSFWFLPLAGRQRVSQHCSLGVELNPN